MSQPLNPMPPNNLEVSSRRRWVFPFALAALLLLLGAAAGFWAVRHWSGSGGAETTQFSSEHLLPDPRLTYAGPFQNVHPDVPYVGDAKCALCHKKETESYRKHSMGKSLTPIAQFAPTQRYDRKANNPFDGLNTQFLVQRQGDGAVHRQLVRDDKGEIVFQADVPVDYVLGSGTHGCSYLMDRDGFLFQSPVSWFSEKQIWDKSPGFMPGMRAGRQIGGLCMFCHANRTRPIEGTFNHYEKPLFEGYAIGCERCHGPGGRHVADPGHKDSVTGADYSIVNPRHLAPELRAAVCEQCHLTGEARFLRRGRRMYDFRPGLPLEQFFAIYVYGTDPKAASKAVNHVEQMYQSQCFLKSTERLADGKRKLGCTSCHDPHVHVDAPERVAYFRARCLNCHGKQVVECSESVAKRQAKADSCIDCHMPRFDSTDIAHNASTDHRLLRRPAKPAPPSAGPPSVERDFVSFYPDPEGFSKKDLDRDLAIGLAKINFKQIRVPTGWWEHDLTLVQAALEDDPNDVEAWEVKGMALAFLNYKQDALAAFETSIAKAPRRESSLSPAATLASQLKQTDKAIDYLRRVLAEDPWDVNSHAQLAQLLAGQKSWDEARRHCEAWLRLDPVDLEARVLWIKCLIKTGDKDLARTEFAKIERLKPPNLPVLQARFLPDLRQR